MGGASLAELQERMPPRSCRSEGCPSSAKRMDAIIPSPSLCVLSSRALLVYACAYLTFVRVQVAWSKFKVDSACSETKYGGYGVYRVVIESYVFRVDEYDQFNSFVLLSCSLFVWKSVDNSLHIPRQQNMFLLSMTRVSFGKREAIFNALGKGCARGSRWGSLTWWDLVVVAGFLVMVICLVELWLAVRDKYGLSGLRRNVD